MKILAHQTSLSPLVVDRALNDAEVSSLYNSSSGKPASSTDSSNFDRSMAWHYCVSSSVVAFSLGGLSSLIDGRSDNEEARWRLCETPQPGQG